MTSESAQWMDDHCRICGEQLPPRLRKPGQWRRRFCSEVCQRTWREERIQRWMRAARERQENDDGESKA